MQLMKNRKRRPLGRERRVLEETALFREETRPGLVTGIGRRGAEAGIVVESNWFRGHCREAY